jgi:hypothetical protein
MEEIKNQENQTVQPQVVTQEQQVLNRDQEMLQYMKNLEKNELVALENLINIKDIPTGIFRRLQMANARWISSSASGTIVAAGGAPSAIGGA